MSFGRVSFAPSLPYALGPDDPPGGGAPPAPAPAPAAMPPTPAAGPGGAPAPVTPVTPAVTPPTLAGGATPPAPPAAAPAGTAPATPTTLAGGAGTPPPVAVPANWPENWRDLAAAGDKTYRTQLDRFDSPEALAKSYRELAAKLSSGELKAPAKPLAADAKPEEIAAWRKEQGLPETADALITGLALPNGIVPGEADKPLLKSFAEAAMKDGLTADTYNKVVGWYYGLQDQLVAERATADSEFMRDSQNSLAQEWGNEYKVNQTVVSSFIEGNFSKDLGKAMLEARLPNGNIAGNDPAFNREILTLAKTLNPAATLLPASSGSTISNVESRIAEIEQKYMRAPRNSPEGKTYWSEPMQKEIRELYGARETMKARAGQAA